MVGDRVLAFRFANKGSVNDWKWQTKHNYVALVNTPGLALLELSFNDATLKFEIAEAHDVPELGAERDLHPRMESYVKDFKAVTIGEMVTDDWAMAASPIATAR